MLVSKSDGQNHEVGLLFGTPERKTTSKSIHLNLRFGIIPLNSVRICLLCGMILTNQVGSNDLSELYIS